MKVGIVVSVLNVGVGIGLSDRVFSVTVMSFEVLVVLIVGVGSGLYVVCLVVVLIVV